MHYITVWCVADHTLIEKINAMTGMQGEQKRSTTHSDPWYYMEAEVNSRPSQLTAPVPTEHKVGGTAADPSLMLSKRHKSPASTRIQNVSCPDQRLLFYTNHANLIRKMIGAPLQ